MILCSRLKLMKPSVELHLFLLIFLNLVLKILMFMVILKRREAFTPCMIRKISLVIHLVFMKPWKKIKDDEDINNATSGYRGGGCKKTFRRKMKIWRLFSERTLTKITKV